MQRKTTRKPSTVGGERRQRRFDERDVRIRKEATALFLERGLNGFSMEDVAKAIDYSKGTVYQHYMSKEDVLVAVLAAHLDAVMGRIDDAAAAPVCPRARIRAISELDLVYTIEHPEVLQLSTVFIVPHILAKAPPERAKAVQAAYDRSNAAERGIVNEAISRGDLVIPEGRKPQHVRFALSSLHFGATYIAAHGSASAEITLVDLGPVILANYETLLDGFAWKPPAASPEYQADLAKIHALLPDCDLAKRSARR
jgi:AcrR family transcriptional regulator